MPDDTERLVVALEARIRDFEKNMQKGERTGTNTYSKLRAGSKSATANMERDMVRSTTRINQALATSAAKVGEYGKAFATGLVGGIAAGGIAGIITSVQGVTTAVAEVGDQAKIAGVNVKAFQELKFVADQNRISVDALTDGLKEMNLRADEFIVTGKGSAAEAFARLGFSADSLKTKLKDPSALFTEIIGKLGQLDKAAQIRIADEIFGGTGGEVFVKLIEQGEKGIRSTIKAANDLGIVMDDELIKKASEVDKRFNQISTTVGTRLKGAVIEAADALQAFIDKFQDFENRRKGAEAAAQVGGMLANPPTGTAPKPASTPADPKGPRLPSATDIIRDKLNEQRLNDAFNGVQGSSKTEKTRSKSKTAAEREREAVKELIAELEEELRLVNASDVAKRASAASRQVGAAATEEERKKVISLTEAIHQEEEARRRAQEQMEFYRDLTQAGLDDLFAGLEQGKSFWESMADVAVNSLKRIGQSMLDDVLDNIFKINNATSGGGGGLFSSIFGSLFGGGFASLPKIGPIPAARPSFDGGGYTGNGSRSGGLDGKGGFMAMLHPRETVVDHTKGGGGSGGANVKVDVGVSMDDNGNLQAYVKNVSTQAARSAVSQSDALLDKKIQNLQKRRAI